MKFGLILTLLSVVNLQFALSQKFSPQLQSMVDAENAFAKFAKDKNVRDAFVANLTDSTILYTKEGPVRGKRAWVDRQPNDNLLIWRPVFVGISASNDFGFSTGPSQWSETREAQPAYYGYFVSVWKKVGSEWKLATDIGSPMPSADASAAQLHSSNPNGTAGKHKNAKGYLMDVDRKYNDELRATGATYISESFSKDAMLKYPYAFPDYFPWEAKSNIVKPDFTSLGAEISQSNDLGYTYGRVTASITDNNSLAPYTANFLRVWKYESNAWKIVIEVISGAQ